MREYRASELGSCFTRQVHKQLGSPALDPPAVLQAAFDRGNTHEDACVAEMRGQGWHVFGEQDAIAMGPDGRIPYGAVIDTSTQSWYLSGHLDGRCRLPGDPPAALPRVLEIKAPNAWAKFERAYKTGCYDDTLTHMYAWQTSVYMVATGLEMVVACVEDGMAEDEGLAALGMSTSRVRYFVIETPIHDEAAILARVGMIDMLAGAGVAPSDCEPGLRDDWSCPYRHLHSAPERAEVEDGHLDHLVGLYASEKALRDSADARMKEYREQIDLHLGLEETRETAQSIATRVTTTRTTYDTKRAMQDGIDLDKYAKVSSSTSIRVTVKDGDGSAPAA